METERGHHTCSGSQGERRQSWRDISSKKIVNTAAPQEKKRSGIQILGGRICLDYKKDIASSETQRK